MEIGGWVNCFILLIDGIIHIIHTPIFFSSGFAIDYSLRLCSVFSIASLSVDSLVSRYYMCPLLAT